MADRRPPRDCPVCGDELALTRLSCSSCGTELSGAFEACDFCALNTEEREVLRVFLASRGNMKELERHLGVSYPTARARYDGLLAKLGIERPSGPDPEVELLEAVARGDVAVDDALGRLS
ncbi:MAG: hypothetical protein QOE35_2808 [Actinomycetota bacterium]|jgi:hypothetical protein